MTGLVILGTFASVAGIIIMVVMPRLQKEKEDTVNRHCVELSDEQVIQLATELTGFAKVGEKGSALNFFVDDANILQVTIKE